MKIYASIVGFLLACASSVQANDCTTITATADPDDPPYSWKHDNKIIGTMPDIAELIADELKVSIPVYFSGSWKRVQNNVISGRFDMVLGIYKTTERLALYDYTNDIMQSPITAVTLKGKPIFYDGTWKSLKSYQGGTTIGDSFGNEFDHYIATELTMTRVPDVLSMLRQLVRGRIQYGVYGKFPTERYAQKIGMSDLIQIHTTPLHVEPLYIAFSKKSPCKHLAETFSKTINTLKEQGLIETILEKNRQLMLKELAH